MISFARQDLILRPIEKRLYLFADERSEGENNSNCSSQLQTEFHSASPIPYHVFLSWVVTVSESRVSNQLQYTGLTEIILNRIGASTRENRSSGFPTRSDTNWAVQAQKMATGLKRKELKISLCKIGIHGWKSRRERGSIIRLQILGTKAIWIL